MSRAARFGFSIFETVAILVILAILLLIAIPQFTRPTLAALAAPDSVVAPSSFGTLSVKVSDSRGTPQRGVTVRFEAEGKGSVSPAEASTDSAGVAHETAILVARLRKFSKHPNRCATRCCALNRPNWSGHDYTGASQRAPQVDRGPHW